MNIAVQDIVFPRSCPVCGKVTKGGGDICADCETQLRKIGGQICHKCGQPVTGASDMWCPACAKSLREEEILRYQLPENRGGYVSAGGKEHYFTQARSLYRYNGPMRQSIYRLKYKNAKEYAIYYGRKMAEYVMEGAFEPVRTSGAVRHTEIPDGETDEYDGGNMERYSRDPARVGNTITRGKAIAGRKVITGGNGPAGLKPVYDAVIPVPMYRKKQRKRGYNQAELLATEIGYHLSLPTWKNYLLRVRDTAPMKELSRSERRKNLREAFAVRKSRQAAPKSVLLIDDIFTTGATADACAYALRLGGVHRIDCLCLAMEDLSV